MKVLYFITNYQNAPGVVYEGDKGNKIIFMRTTELDIEMGIEFRNNRGEKIVDDEVMNILIESFTRGEYGAI